MYLLEHLSPFQFLHDCQDIPIQAAHLFSLLPAQRCLPLEDLIDVFEFLLDGKDESHGLFVLGLQLYQVKEILVLKLRASQQREVEGIRFESVPAAQECATHTMPKDEIRSLSDFAFLSFE